MTDDVARSGEQVGDETKRALAGGTGPKALFPGEIYVTEGERLVHVKKWGARDVTQEVPAMLGRLAGKVAVAQGTGTEEMVAIVVSAAAGEAAEFVAFSTDLTLEEVESELTAGDLLGVLDVVIKLNSDFFGRLAGLYARVSALELGKRSP